MGEVNGNVWEKSLQSAMQTMMVKAREWWTTIDN